MSEAKPQTNPYNHFLRSHLGGDETYIYLEREIRRATLYKGLRKSLYNLYSIFSCYEVRDFRFEGTGNRKEEKQFYLIKSCPVASVLQVRRYVEARRKKEEVARVGKTLQKVDISPTFYTLRYQRT